MQSKGKIKTRRAAAKRYRVTGKGRVKVGRKNHRHLLTGKSRKQKRATRGTKLLPAADEATAKLLVPYA